MAWDENLDGILEDFGSMLMDVNSTSYIDGFFGQNLLVEL